MVKLNRKRRRTKKTGAKIMHIVGRAYDTGHGGRKATSKRLEIINDLPIGFPINNIISQTVSEDHALRWIHKDLTVTTKKIQALLTAARALGGLGGYGF